MAALQKNNFTEPNFTQKSGDVGRKILEIFCNFKL
jgi:hypothetical protein